MQLLTVKQSARQFFNVHPIFRSHVNLALLANFIAGCLGGFVLAPYSFTWLSWLMLIPLIAASFFSSAKVRLSAGFLYGLGYGLSILLWVPQTVYEFSDLSSLSSYLFTACFVLYSAMVPALVCWLPRRITQNRTLHLWLVLPLCWAVLMELLVEAFIGVPNLTLGMAQIDGPLRWVIPIAGEWGSSVLLMWINAALFALLLPKLSPRRFISSALVALVVFLPSYFLLDRSWTTAKTESLSVAMVLGSVELKRTDSEESKSTAIEEYTRLSSNLGVDVVIWPETALPLNAGDFSAFQQFAADLKAQEVSLIAGTWEIAQNNQLYNTVRVYGKGDGQLYRKRFLVPFVEKMPFSELYLSPEEIPVLAGARMANIRLRNVEVGSSICWEMLFRRYIVSSVEAGAEVLINHADDSWAASHSMFERNIQIARFRALETGRSVIRVAASGGTVVIDHLGQIQLLDFSESGVSRIAVTPRIGLTPALWFGQSVFILSSLVFLLLVFGHSHLRLLSRYPVAYGKAAAGFTIIELVAVIALLGILSAVALPRFVNMRDDASLARFEAVRGSFSTSVTSVHAVVMARGKDSGGTYPVFELEGGDIVNINNTTGYPNVFQPNANCSTAMNAPAWLESLAIASRNSVLLLLGVNRVHAADSVPVGSADPRCALPELLLQGDYGLWTWDWNAVNGTAVFTDPEGNSFTYSQLTGEVQ